MSIAGVAPNPSPSAESLDVPSYAMQNSSNNNLGCPRQIFSGMILSTCGCLTKSRDEMRRLIERHGGKSVAKTSRQVAMLITTPQDAQEDTKVSVKNARRFSIPIVVEEYVVDCIKQQKLLETTAYEIPFGGTLSVSRAPIFHSYSDDDEDDEEDSDDGPHHNWHRHDSSNDTDHRPSLLNRRRARGSTLVCNTGTISPPPCDAEHQDENENHIADDELALTPESTPLTVRSKIPVAHKGQLQPRNLVESPPPPTPPRSNTPTPRKSSRVIVHTPRALEYEPNYHDDDGAPKKTIPTVSHKKRGRPPKRTSLPQLVPICKRPRTIEPDISEEIAASNTESDVSDDDQEIMQLTKSVIQGFTNRFFNHQKQASTPTKVRLRHRRRCVQRSGSSTDFDADSARHSFSIADLHSSYEP